MIRTRLPFLLLAATANTAWAQPPAPPRWQVDWGQYYCSLVRPSGEGRPFATAIIVIPGGDSTQIIFIPDGGSPPSRRASSLLLLPQGTAFDVSLATERRGERDVAVVSGLPYEFRGSLVGATELQLKEGNQIRLRIPLPNARAAVAAHRQCTAQIAREWGVDEAALAALRQRPVTTNLFGINADDYPPEALLRAIEGRVLVRIAVSAQGRASECATVATSGSAVIDETTCRVIRRRARFRPARDAAGRAVPARYVSSVTWLVPRD